MCGSSGVYRQSLHPPTTNASVLSFQDSLSSIFPLSSSLHLSRSPSKVSSRSWWRAISFMNNTAPDWFGVINCPFPHIPLSFQAKESQWYSGLCLIFQSQKVDSSPAQKELIPVTYGIQVCSLSPPSAEPSKSGMQSPLGVGGMGSRIRL